MKTLLAILLLIPSLSFSESTSKIIDTYFSDDNCVQVDENYFRCNYGGISFYGQFIDGLKEGIGIYEQIENDLIIYLVAEHQNGKLSGEGKTILKINEYWNREFILPYYEFDYPNDLVEMSTNPSENLSFTGVFYDNWNNYYIFGEFDYVNLFLEDNYYAMTYYNEWESDTIPSSYRGCVYTAKVDFNSLSKLVITPKDGMASIGCIDSEKSNEDKTFGSRYIGFIKNMREHGKGFKELNYSQRPADTLDIPPLDYFKDISNQKNFETGDFLNGELVSTNTDFLEDSEQYTNFDKETYTAGWYYVIGEERLKFNEKYDVILSDIEGYINLFYQ